MKSKRIAGSRYPVFKLFGFEEAVTAVRRSEYTACHCAELPRFDYFSERRKLGKKLLATTDEVEKRDECGLRRCRICSTFWRIEGGKRGRFAWKIGEFRRDWADVRHDQEKKALLLKRRGGTTKEKCVWAGCEGCRLVGSALCLEHLFATGDRR